MYIIKLDWKEFSVDLAALNQQLIAAYPNYVGNQAHSVLELCFSEEPSQEDKAAIEQLWAALDPDDDLAASYQSFDQIQAAKEAQKQSAKAKLLALGLTETEAQALLGV